ncbi:MAG: sulfurtransferase [Roseiflexus sp.]|nr:sulfurtransferase [Roseiflexus sp.]MCS7290490.1 sulfurtransferase [Roseiflexus sp.]MDW8148369.1 sulfurtransferase [Roseiflexaceae bacterium]MDW8232303.1 sulfurtransferase [Roseiflexaceae bacterium]
MDRTLLRTAGAAVAGALVTLAIVAIVSSARPQPTATSTVAPTAPVAPAVASSPREPRKFEDVVVSTEWLAQNLDNPKVRVIEVSVVPGLYERGHIPGAVNFVWTTDLVDTVSRDIVAPARFQELARAAGINNDTTIVLYGDNNNWFAAWGAWIFRQYGAEDVRLLDGGRSKWEAETRELSTRAPTYPQGDFTVRQRSDLRVFLPDVLKVVRGEDDRVLVDIRSPDEFSGKIFAPEGFQELAVRAGHIPGAINIPWKKALKDDGTFKSVEELRKLYADAGVDGSKPIITYCRIGERASHTWFVLSEILGYQVALYDGSWTEYGNSVGVPIANPAGTIWGVK